jgi:cysteine desulfurase
VYLDYHATTPVDPRVVEAMLPYFTDIFGNPASSGHAWGWQAQNAVEVARGEVASLIGAQARDITFTSGATESNNFALKGLSRAVAPGRRHLVVSAIEHKSVLEGAMAQAASGWRVTVVPVRPDGRLDLDGLAAAVGPETALVSVMAASNEIGVTQPLADIAAIAHDAGALLHTDAAQAAGKIPIDVAAQGIDFLSLTGHKMYGPKGAGAIYIRRPLKLDPLLVGGGQERGVRSGTLNVPGIVGLGRAAAIAQHDMAAEAARLAALRNRLLAGLEDRVGGIAVNGSMTTGCRTT